MKTSPTTQLSWLVNTPVMDMLAMIREAGSDNAYPRNVTAAAMPNGKRNWQVDRIVCADGTQLSVQACHTMYCSPRNDQGPYTRVEVGYPTRPVGKQWREYKDGGPETPDQGTVFGYVPVYLVQRFIQKHGGERITAPKPTKLKLPRKLKKWLKDRAVRPSWKYQNGIKSKDVRIEDAWYDDTKQGGWRLAGLNRRRLGKWKVLWHFKERILTH